MESSVQFFVFTLLLMLSTCASGMLSQPCNITFDRQHGYCILFGQCENSPYIAGGFVNCFDHIPAKDVSAMGADFKKLLQEVCPQYVAGGQVCCDHAQLNQLAEQIKYPSQLFSHCPACLKNFLSYWCAVNCDPDQSLFMTPLTCNKVMVPDAARWAVPELSVYVDRKYAEDLFRSCSHVQYLQSGTRVIDITCGGGNQCNASAWLNYLGDPKKNHNSPFLVQPLLVDSPYPKTTLPIAKSVIPCDTVDSQDACECRDCYPVQLCPSPPPHVLNSSFTITLKAKEPIYSVFQPYDVYGVSNWTFGPVLTNDVLLEVYAIQDHLVNMLVKGTLSDGTEVRLSLSDICYQPMAPVNKNCSIISVFNYFQNDLTKLKHTEIFGLVNNSYHIYYCTRNPTATTNPFFRDINMPCLGAFGGPIYPELALKEYNDINGFPNYNNATELVISFVVKDTEIPALAEIWEEALLDFVKNYHGTFVDISY